MTTFHEVRFSDTSVHVFRGSDPTTCLPCAPDTELSMSASAMDSIGFRVRGRCVTAAGVHRTAAICTWVTTEVGRGWLLTSSQSKYPVQRLWQYEEWIPSIRELWAECIQLPVEEVLGTATEVLLKVDIMVAPSYILKSVSGFRRLLVSAMTHNSGFSVRLRRDTTTSAPGPGTFAPRVGSSESEPNTIQLLGNGLSLRLLTRPPSGQPALRWGGRALPTWSPIPARNMHVDPASGKLEVVLKHRAILGFVVVNNTDTTVSMRGSTAAVKGSTFIYVRDNEPIVQESLTSHNPRALAVTSTHSREGQAKLQGGMPQPEADTVHFTFRRSGPSKRDPVRFTVPAGAMPLRGVSDSMELRLCAARFMDALFSLSTEPPEEALTGYVTKGCATAALSAAAKHYLTSATVGLAERTNETYTVVPDLYNPEALGCLSVQFVTYLTAHEVAPGVLPGAHVVTGGGSATTGAAAGAAAGSTSGSATGGDLPAPGLVPAPLAPPAPPPAPALPAPRFRDYAPAPAPAPAPTSAQLGPSYWIRSMCESAASDVDM